LKLLNTRELSSIKQFIISTAIILSIALIAFVFNELIGYKVVALILLMALSLIAMLFEIKPVLFSAILSSLIWNFFFIPPIFTFHITSTEDGLMFLLYFIIAFVNTVLSFKIRKEEKKARQKEKEVEQIQFYNTLLNSLSHELRTPISTIIGSTDILKEYEEKITVENKHLLLQEIQIAGLKLNHHVENLLNMSRLESGLLVPKFEWCDINEEMFRFIKNNFQNNSRIEFQANDNLPICKTDIGFLEQIVINIIKNALQYTPEEKPIQIQLGIDHQILHISFQDYGNGIPEEHLPYIFDKFFRVPQTITGGTGLGLSIVKGFTDALNGTIEVKNIQPNGLKFDIFVPVETTYINNLKNE